MSKSIELTTAHNVKFPTFDKKKGNVLILGNFDGVIGKSSAESFFDLDYHDVSYQNLGVIIDAIKSNKNVYVIGEKKCTDYFRKIMGFVLETGVFESASEQKFRNMLKAKRNTTALRNHFKTITTNFDEWATGNTLSNFNEDNEIYKTLIASNMKFDTIIQNPPFNGSLHLDFLEKGLELLNPNGKMVIIEPATWLINIRKFGKKGERGKTASSDIKKYDVIKQRLKGHIESVVIENLNNEFGTRLQVPFATTTIDMGKTFENICFENCKEKKYVKSIYDCNLVGDYNTIWSILDKVQKYGNMMIDHITNEDKGRDYWYTKYAEIVGSGLCGDEKRVYSDVTYRETKIGEYNINYFTVGYHTESDNNISNIPIERNDCRKRKIEGSVADNIYGTRTELENWKHFIFNNKLPLFINIVMTIDQHNNSKQFLPWLVDKQYTDDEINEMFGFTDEEIKLIDTTIKKYERNSPWFKRYMCGKDSVTDDEVNNFIEKLMREC